MYVFLHGDFGESDKMIKISGKMNKSKHNGFSGNSSVNEERNITTKPIVSVLIYPLFDLFL